MRKKNRVTRLGYVPVGNFGEGALHYRHGSWTYTFHKDGVTRTRSTGTRVLKEAKKWLKKALGITSVARKRCGVVADQASSDRFSAEKRVVQGRFWGSLKSPELQRSVILVHISAAEWKLMFDAGFLPEHTVALTKSPGILAAFTKKCAALKIPPPKHRAALCIRKSDRYLKNTIGKPTVLHLDLCKSWKFGHRALDDLKHVVESLTTQGRHSEWPSELLLTVSYGRDRLEGEEWHRWIGWRRSCEKKMQKLCRSTTRSATLQRYIDYLRNPELSDAADARVGVLRTSLRTVTTVLDVYKAWQYDGSGGHPMVTVWFKHRRAIEKELGLPLQSLKPSGSLNQLDGHQALVRKNIGRNRVTA